MAEQHLISGRILLCFVLLAGCTAASAGEARPWFAAGPAAGTPATGAGMPASADRSASQAAPLSTGSTCPSVAPPTYATFGQQFMSSYCLRCHASTLSGKAPPDRQLDDIARIRLLAAQLDQQAAAGPLGAHRTMPPDAPTPSDAERLTLGAWLACGAP